MLSNTEVIFTAGLRLACCLIVTLLCGWAPESAACQVVSNDWPAGILTREKLPTKRSFDYDFSDLSVQTLQKWLGRVGVEVPVELDGNLSGWVWAQRSATSWLDFSNYIIEGEIRSPELMIEKWQVTEAAIRFGYAGGNWYIGKLGGQLNSPLDRSRVGIAIAQAKISTATSGNIEINSKVDSVNLKSLLRAFGIDVEIENAGGSVSLVGTIPMATVDNLSTWTATAGLDLNDVVTPWIESSGKASAVVKLANSAWNVTQGQINVADQSLTMTGTGRLDPDLPFEVAVAGRDINTALLLRQLKNEALAKQIDGDIQLRAKIAGNQSTGVRVATASIESDLLTLNAQPIKQVKVTSQYTPTEIRLDIASAGLASGSVTGFAIWPDLNRLSQNAPTEANLDVSNLMIEEVALLELPFPVRGQATGRLKIATQMQEKNSDWSSTGDLEIVGFEAAGTKFGLAKLDWNKELVSNSLTGSLSVQQSNGSSLQAKIEAVLIDDPESTLRATTLQDYRATGQLQDYDLVVNVGEDRDDWIPIRAAGSFDIAGSSKNWIHHGSAKFTNSFAKLGDRLIRVEMADVSFNPGEFRLERFRLLDETGRIAGAASFKRDKTGEHLLRMRMVDVELKPYVERLLPESLRSIDGVAAFELDLRKDAATEDLAGNWSGQWSGALTGITFQGQSVGDLNLNGNIVDQMLTANVDGQLFGGAADASLTLPIELLDSDSGRNPTAESNSSLKPAELNVQLNKAQAQQLSSLFFDRSISQATSGAASLTLNASGRSREDLVATVKIDVPVLIQKRTEFARELVVQLRYAENKLLVERLSGGLAEGRIDAKGQIEIGNQSVSFNNIGRVNFLAQDLNVNRLVDLFYPEYAQYYSGELSYRGTATLQRGLLLTGSASIKNGGLFGFPVKAAYGTLRTEFERNGEFRRVTANNMYGIGLGGNFDAELVIEGGKRYSLATSGRVSNGKLEQLSKSCGFEQIVGAGTFNGFFDLKSSQIESLDAMLGSLQIDFKNGDVKSVPIVSSLDRFVPLAQFSSADIENGRLNANIGQGQLRINNLILNSKAFLLAASGNVSLSRAELDIDAVLQTGGGVQQRLTQTAMERLLVGSIPQLAAINELNELIRNRSVFLHVGGTASRPVVQAKTGQTAAKAFMQNFGRNFMGTTPLTVR